MAQFSCCWCNSACGGWLVENSWETSGPWILHWGRFLGKMLCICLCLQSTWPLYALSFLSRLFPSERGGAAAANAKLPHQHRRQPVWRPAPSEVTPHKSPFTCVSHLSNCHFTPATGLKRKTRRRLLTRRFAFRSIVIGLFMWTQATAHCSHVRLLSETLNGLQKRKTSWVKRKSKDYNMFKMSARLKRLLHHTNVHVFLNTWVQL